MRVLDILTNNLLTEGPVKVADFSKEPYRLQNLIKKLETNDPFRLVSGDSVVIPATKQEIMHLKGELANKFDLSDPGKRALKKVEMPNTIGGIKLTSIEKTKEFGGKVSINASGEADVSRANLGPTVEALKSFAMYAKLVMRGKENITAEDVLTIGKLAAEHSKVDYAINPKTGKKSKTRTAFAVYSRQVPDTGGTVKDEITLKIALSQPSFQRAIETSPSDKTAWGNLQGIVKYVNQESDLERYTKLFANNNKRDPLKISVVGIGGAKTDIASTYTTPSGTEKPIQSLSMSLKAAGAMWYDQAPGNTLDGMIKFYDIMGLDEDLAERSAILANYQEGDKNSSDKEFADRYESYQLIYEIAYNQLKARIRRLNNKGEANYIHTFLGNLKNSIAGDQRIVYVKFDSNGTYAKAKPHLLYKLADIIELDIEFTVSDSGRPAIHWVDKKTGRTLVWVVCARTPSEKRITHQFNLGNEFFEMLKEAENTSGDNSEVDNADLLPKGQQASTLKQADKAVDKIQPAASIKAGPSMGHPAGTPAVKRAVRTTAPAPTPEPDAVTQMATPAKYPQPPAYNPSVEV